jgi:DNA-binding NarL/FixJ family response regulator
MSARAIPPAAQVGAAAKVECPHRLAGSALLTEADWVETAHTLQLSGRELQIVRGVFDNRKEAAIAAELGIAPRTVDTHLERLYRKLTVTTRVALVLRVMEEVLRAKARPETGNGSVLAATARSGPGAGGVG